MELLKELLIYKGAVVNLVDVLELNDIEVEEIIPKLYSGELYAILLSFD